MERGSTFCDVRFLRSPGVSPLPSGREKECEKVHMEGFYRPCLEGMYNASIHVRLTKTQSHDHV